MKKCPYCKKEIPSDTTFCGYCGKSLDKYLEETSFNVLYELAMGYLANKKVAKEIAKEFENKEDAIRELGKKCVSYIQKRNIDLFQDEMISKGTKELEKFNNFEKDIVPLDYEERIVSIMKVKEGLTIQEIKDILGIEEDHIHALLESSYNKIHPEPKKAPVIKVDNKEEPKKTPNPFFKKVRRIAVALIILFLAGYLGLREYVSREYTLGLEAKERNDNEEAIKHLRRAVRFGGANSESEVALANVYYDTQDYLSASIRYEDYINAGGDSALVNEKLSYTYNALAQEALNNGDTQVAVDYFKKEYKISSNEEANRMIKIIQSNESPYIDNEGNEYSEVGYPTLLKASKNGKELYEVSVEYDEGYISRVKVDNTYIDDIKIKENEIYEINCYPSDNDTRYKVIKNIYQNNLLNQTETTVGKKSNTVEYEYEFDESNKATKRYEVGNERNITILTYDTEGRLNKEASTSEEFRVEATTYTYEEDILKEVVVDKSRDKENPTKTIYEYTGYSKPYRAYVYNDKDVEIAKGYYIKDNVWIFLYNQKESER